MIDVSSCETWLELHALLASALRFPDWYGQNWDAFRDCVLDSKLSNLPAVVRIKGIQTLATRLPRDAELLEESLRELAATRPNIEVCVQP